MLWLPLMYKLLDVCDKPIVIMSRKQRIKFSNKAFNKTFDKVYIEDNMGDIKDTQQRYLLMKTDNKSHAFEVNVTCLKQYKMVMFDLIDEFVLNEQSLIDMYSKHTTLMYNMYPKHIADSLLTQQFDTLAKSHSDVTVCFADIYEFTDMCSNMRPQSIMHFLNALFGEFDELRHKYHIYKLETVGDCYVTASGLVSYNDQTPCTSIHNMLKFAKEMITAAHKHNVKLRVGIHTGDVMSGVIDSTMPKWCLFGDAMNMTSRMETTCIPMHLHVSEATYSMMHPDDREGFYSRDTVIKGKGLCRTYLYECPSPNEEARVTTPRSLSDNLFIQLIGIKSRRESRENTT